MGVWGLQSFLKNNSVVSQKTEITNTSLVIDANNLICLLFCNLCKDRNSSQWKCDIYGGDLVAYGEAVKEFFTNLDKCCITPILVFDGSVIGKQSTQDQQVLKEKTVYKRGLERFQLAKRMVEESQEESIVLPKMISYIFKNIVHDLGYQMIQTPYEADSHIARVANDLDCYVLTNDSDFLIYSLPKGFVMIDSFYYKNIITTKNGRHLIGCIVYSQDRLIRCFPGLRSESMPLLSVLLGNDYVEMGTFDRVLEQMLNRTHNTSSLVAETRAHRKIVTLLTWLRNKTVEESIEYILSFIRSTDRARLERTIKTLLRSYLIEKTDNFEAELMEIYPTSKADQSNKTDHPELLPPGYLRRLFENADLHPIALDIIFHNTNYNYPSIDDFQLISASYVRNRPFSLAITLLRPSSYSGMTTYKRQTESERDAFHIYDRIKEDYCKIILRPMEHLDGFGSLEHLNCYSMILLEPGLKKSLLMHIFRFNNDELNLLTDILSRVFESQFLNEASTCLLLVKYIGLETRCPPKPQFVDALMLTLFYYAALNGQLKTNSFVDTNYGQLLLRLRPHSFSNNGKHYGSSTSLYRRIVHFISQLEAAYSSYCLLNTLLNHVFQVPRFERFLNGTLVFRLTKLLRVGELELATLCKELPTFVEACASIKTIVHCDE